MEFLPQALIYLAAAVICVPVARKLGMGSVLGYLTAGILIGPFVLGFIGKEGQDIMHFAEFGVVMMLFLIGLELEPAHFWRLRKTILGMGSAQLAGTTLLILLIMLLSGFTWRPAIAIALAVSMSSTAIALQTIREKGLIQTAAGQSSFSVLLFQDIAVIPILAILPLLAVTAVNQDGSGHQTLIEQFPGWVQTLAIFLAIGLIYAAGKFLVVPLLRLIAKTRLRELFTAASLFLVVAIATLMQSVGLSPALGTFLAGVVLANSEYRHELESDLEPFKGLLLGLFFLGVGASINFQLIAEKPVIVFGLVFGIMVIKSLVLFFTGRFYGMKNDQNFLFTFALSQIGEFAFVLFSFTGRLSIIDQETMNIMMAVTAITMGITPILLLLNEKVIDPRFGTTELPQSKPADNIDENNRVIIAGFGHFGSTIGRFLRANGVEATILDNDSDRVDLLRKMGFKVYYGDATRVDLLRSAGAEDASIFIAAIDSPETNREIVSTVQKHFPAIRLMVRARNRMDAYELIDMGIQSIYRESLHTSVTMAVDVLQQLGYRAYTARRQGQKFIRYDEEALMSMASHRHDQKQYILKARENFRLQEDLLSLDRSQNLSENDHAWDSEEIREGLKHDAGGKSPATSS
jgi:CPA2 family monovalent cation:H+ antiporter-2